MSRITLTKELINNALKELERCGFWGTDPEIVRIVTQSNIDHPRFGFIEPPKSQTQHAIEQQKIIDEIEGFLNIKPNTDKKIWIRVINRLIDEKKLGHTVENYAKWWNASDEFSKPKRFKIQENPNLIFADWKIAQNTNSSPAPYRIG